MELEIMGVLTIMSGAVATLWAWARKQAKQDREDLGDCRRMHEKAMHEIAELNGKYNYLQGRLDGVEQQLTRSK